LEKDGWTITDDPLHVKYGKVDLYVDLGAEKLLAAEKDGSKIAVEIKGFESSSPTSEFHAALGQFLGYHEALEAAEPERVLYLAIPEDTFESYFELEFPRRMVAKFGVKLVIYRPEEEVIVTWKN
jgi:XisH protein